MKKNKYFILIIFFITLFYLSHSNSEIIILSMCENKKDGFLKNEYILDLEKLIMTRNRKIEKLMEIDIPNGKNIHYY